MTSREQINRNFTYIPPTPAEVEAMAKIRATCKELAELIDWTVPDSREKSVAITNLEQVSMWANAGIVRNRVEVDE